VRFSSRQFVLASALLAAWLTPGGNGRAGADYVSTLSLRGSHSPVSALGRGFWEEDCTSGAASSGTSEEKLSLEPMGRERDSSPVPFLSLFRTCWHFEGPGDADTSTGSNSTNHPPGQQTAALVRLELLGLTALGSVLPDDSVLLLPSVTSRLFRPPRAHA
jgi:hypothetical protein